MDQSESNAAEDAGDLTRQKHKKSRPNPNPNDDNVAIDLTVTVATNTNTIPSSIISVFVNQDAIRAGSPLEIPVQSSTKQLEQLVNTLLENEQQVLFFHKSVISKKEKYLYIY